MKKWTLDQFARHYVETMAKPANAWGQHVSDIFGKSHHIMIAAGDVYPSDHVQKAFEKAIKEAIQEGKLS
jgi:hypothetical protein